MSFFQSQHPEDSLWVQTSIFSQSWEPRLRIQIKGRKKRIPSLVYSARVYNVPTEFQGRLILRLLQLPQSTAASSHDVQHSFLITCTLTSGSFTLSASAAPANMSSCTQSHALVEAASLEFNTFFSPRQTWFTWSRCLLNADKSVRERERESKAQTIVPSGSIGQFTVQPPSAAKCLHNTWKAVVTT